MGNAKSNFEDLGSDITSVADTVGNGFTSVGNGTANFFTNTGDDIKNTAVNVADDVANLFSPSSTSSDIIPILSVIESVICYPYYDPVGNNTTMITVNGVQTNLSVLLEQRLLYALYLAVGIEIAVELLRQRKI